MSPSVSATFIEQCIERDLGRALRAEGHVKKGRTFFKPLETCVFLVNVQGSAWNSSEGARFTLNLAVYFPEGKKRIPGRLPTPLPKIHQIPMQARIGILMPANKDHWWEIATEADVEPVSLQVRDAWQAYGRPWLESAAQP